MKSPGGGKALLIEKPTVNGQVSSFPLAINTMGSHRRMAMSLGAESIAEVAGELAAHWSKPNRRLVFLMPSNCSAPR